MNNSNTCDCIACRIQNSLAPLKNLNPGDSPLPVIIATIILPALPPITASIAAIPFSLWLYNSYSLILGPSVLAISASAILATLAWVVVFVITMDTWTFGDLDNRIEQRIREFMAAHLIKKRIKQIRKYQEKKQNRIKHIKRLLKEAYNKKTSTIEAKNQRNKERTLEDRYNENTDYYRLAMLEVEINDLKEALEVVTSETWYQYYEFNIKR